MMDEHDFYDLVMLSVYRELDKRFQSVDAAMDSKGLYFYCLDAHQIGQEFRVFWEGE